MIEEHRLTPEHIKLLEAMQEELLPLDGVLAVEVEPNGTLYVFIENGKSLWELPNIFHGRPISFRIGKAKTQDISLDDYE